MADRPFAEVVGDSPVEADTFPGLAFVFRERPAGGPDEASMRWHDDTGMR